MNNARSGRSGKEIENFPDAVYVLILSSRRAFALHWKGMQID